VSKCDSLHEGNQVFHLREALVGHLGEIRHAKKTVVGFAPTRVDGTAIGSTNASGLLILPLTTAIVAGGNGSNAFWSGMNGDWTTSGQTCSGWTSILGNQFGTIGSAGSTSAELLKASGVNCSVFSFPIVCIEQ
jgi:hypothetical protein